MMKSIWISALAVLGLAATARADGASAYLAYKYTDDADHGVGPGAMYTFDLDYNLRVDLRVTYLAFGHPDLDMVPVEAALAYQMREYMYEPYFGASVGYYMHGANRGDVDNDIGVQLFAGMEQEVWPGVDFFAELNYLFLEPKVDATFARNEGTGSDISLNGIGLNLGLSLRF